MNTILIIANNGLLQGSLTETLMRNGYRIRIASTGADALSQIEAVPPDLIVVHIPCLGTDRWKTLQRIRQTSEAPVIALGNPKSAIKSLDNGADHFVEKPFGAREVCARARALLRRAEAKPMYPTGWGLRAFWPADKASLEEAPS